MLVGMGLATWFAQRNGIDPPPPSAAQERAGGTFPDFTGSPAIAALLGYADPSIGVVGENAALNLSSVFRAVSIVAGSIGGLPLRTMRGTEAAKAARVPSFLDNPGGDLYTPVEWAELTMVHLLLHGNAYLHHIKDGTGRLRALHPIHPSHVGTEWDSTRPGGKRFEVTLLTGEHHSEVRTETFDSRTMTQIMGPSLDGLVGLSALTCGRLSLGTALAGERAANRQMRNGSMIAGLVSPADAEADLDEDEAKVVKDAVNRTMVGPEHAGDIAVMSRALKFQQWQMTAADAQFIESRVFSVDEVGRWFGVPPHLLGLTEKSSSWGQGIAEQNRGLARYTLSSWTGKIQQRMTRLLPAAQYAEFDYTAFVRPSPEDETRLLIDQMNSGLLTQNEARAIINRPPLPGGDTPRVPAGALDPNAAKPPAKEGAP